MIGQKTAIGDRPHRVTLQNPGPPVSDGDGGFTQSWTDLVPPALYVRIEVATAVALERIAAGTVIATATHLMRGPYHPQVTTLTRIQFGGRVFQVAAAVDREQRQQDMVIVCQEQVP
jgi:SPP1 family predicted phage head-tail adaptor